MLNTSLRCFQSLSNSPRDAAPSLGFDFELLPSSLRQAVVFRATAVFGISPKGGKPTLFVHSVLSGKERAWLNGKRGPSDLLDFARDSHSVHLASEKRFWDQQ